MGNVAICFIQGGMDLSVFLHKRRLERIESRRVRTLVPRYLARLSDGDASVTTLNLNGAGVDTRVLRTLCCALLGGGTRVTELYLEGNRIGQEGAACVARLLSKDERLTEVSLANNPVGSVGVMAVASALEHNRTLERLDFSHCEIEDDGIRRFAKSLQRNATLRYLLLEGNPLTSSGVHDLLRCVYDTTSMSTLWESNHAVRAFYGQHGAPYSASFPNTLVNRQLMCQLGEVLAMTNWWYHPSSSPVASAGELMELSARRVAACKILRHYVKKEYNKYLEAVEGMEEKMVPNVVSWLVRYGDVGVIYRVVRDMPWLLEKKRTDGGGKVAPLAPPRRDGAQGGRTECANSLVADEVRMECVVSQ